MRIMTNKKNKNKDQQLFVRLGDDQKLIHTVSNDDMTV